MSRYVRFHAISQKQNLGVMTVILAGIFVAGQLFPNSAYVSAYYGMVPIIIVLLSLITAAAVTTSQLTMAITMGGNRRDYFWSMHLIPVIHVVYGLVTTLIFRQFRPNDRMFHMIAQMNPLWVALAIYVAFYVGTALGILAAKHPFWGIAITALSCGLSGAIIGYQSTKFIYTSVGTPIAIVSLVAFVGVLLWNIYLKKYIERYSV